MKDLVMDKGLFSDAEQQKEYRWLLATHCLCLGYVMPASLAAHAACLALHDRTPAPGP
jgi:hypothetical protein